MMKTDLERMTQFVQLMRARPGMVLGSSEHCLSRLQAFLFGIRWAHDLCLDVDLRVLRLLPEYESWVSNKWTGSTNAVGWFRVLMQEHPEDEEKAVADFFKEWDAFVDAQENNEL